MIISSACKVMQTFKANMEAKQKRGKKAQTGKVQLAMIVSN